MISDKIVSGYGKLNGKTVLKRTPMDRIIKKMREISEDPESYKPLRHELKGTYRVHVGSFVLLFSVNDSDHVVVFLDFDHHDKIYC